MTVKYRKYGYHVQGAYTTLRSEPCKHSKSHKISFGGRYCPTCNKNIVEPQLNGEWQLNKKERYFLRVDDDEKVDEETFIQNVGLRVVDAEEGFAILNEIIRNRKLKEKRSPVV